MSSSILASTGFLGLSEEVAPAAPIRGGGKPSKTPSSISLAVSLADSMSDDDILTTLELGMEERAVGAAMLYGDMPALPPKFLPFPVRDIPNESSVSSSMVSSDGVAPPLLPTERRIMPGGTATEEKSICCLSSAPFRPATGDGRVGRLLVLLFGPAVPRPAPNAKANVSSSCSCCCSPAPKPTKLPTSPAASVGVVVVVARSNPAIPLRRLRLISSKASVMVRRRLDGGADGLVFIVPPRGPN